MTKKLFESVAKILRDTIDDPLLRAMVSIEFVRLFTEKNERFDEHRFLSATKRNSGRVWEYHNGMTIED